MLVAGVDEVGRGPLAGPVVAAAVVLPDNFVNSNFIDSKKLSAKRREELVYEIKAISKAWAIVAVGHKRIEQINIREASKLAMSLAVSKVAQQTKIDLVLVDGNMPINTAIEQKTVIKGDSLHVQISAASIIAKVYRDNLMATLDSKYPGYNFGKHAGYPTPAHKLAISSSGPCKIHRATFAGVKEHLGIYGKALTS